MRHNLLGSGCKHTTYPAGQHPDREQTVLSTAVRGVVPRPGKSVTRGVALLLLWSLLLCSQTDAFALRVDAASYGYPYEDPYLATTAVAIMKGRRDPDSSVHQRSLEVKVLPHRNDIYLLEGKGRLRILFYQRDTRAPLIFIIPGLGASAYSGSARYVADLLADEGFQVMILPSPFNWNFALAASRSGVPGLTQEDSEDLYSAMQLALAYVKQRYGAQIGRLGVLGLSDGALDAAYIAKLDGTRRKLNIATYLLVNPPVDLLEAMRKIDRMAELAKNFSAEERRRIEAYALGVVTESLHGKEGDPWNDQDYFSHWDRRFRLTDGEIQYLIGKDLESSVGDVIYVRGLMHPSGLLKTSISDAHRNARFNEAHSYNLSDYANIFIEPRLNPAIRRTSSARAIALHLSLRGVQGTLEQNKSIFVMHNVDDFLVSRADLNYLQRVLADRLILYPHGGHLGNLWYSQNKRDLVNVFVPLLTPGQGEPGGLWAVRQGAGGAGRMTLAALGEPADLRVCRVGDGKFSLPP
jgi:predicted alpha/beta-fold hydrolase